MKLRTEVVLFQSDGETISTGSGPKVTLPVRYYTLSDGDDAAIHDAMAAHALLQAMEAEPEFPGQMPDEMWEALRNDRDALTFAFGASVRATKAEIKHRAAEILAGWLGEKRG